MRLQRPLLNHSLLRVAPNTGAESLGRIRLNNLLWPIGAVLLIAMMYTPRSNLEIKLFFLIPTLCLIAMGIYWNAFKPIGTIVEVWFLFFMLFGATWCLIGFTKGNPGSFDYLRLYIIWILLYYFLQVPLIGQSGSRFIFNCALIATLLICIYNITFLLNSMKIIPDTIITNAEMGANIGIHEGYIQLSAHNIGTLMFLAPMALAAVLGGYFSSPKEKSFGVCLLIISTIIVILSGRRALLFIVLISPILTWFIWIIVNKQKSIKVRYSIARFYLFLIFLGCSIAIGLIAFTQWDFQDFLLRITGAFTDDDGIRIAQGKALLDGWKESPFWGHGFGIGVNGVVRDTQAPWVYELSYHLLLHNVGIIGLAWWLVVISTPIFYAIKIIRQRTELQKIMVPLIVGEISFLIANATNPYLGSYDFMFVLFVCLPIMKII